jgi:hypothetical protein
MAASQSSIEGDDDLQMFYVLVALGLALRPSVDRQEPDADLSKIWRGRPGPLLAWPGSRFGIHAVLKWRTPIEI